MEDREVQLIKALLSIIVTVAGITTEVREEQPSKAPAPIFDTVISSSLMIIVEGILISPEYFFSPFVTSATAM